MPDSPNSNPRLASLTRFVDHPDLLAEHTMSSVEWEAVEVLMPRILRGKSKEDVKQLLLAEIDGMSKKRLIAVLAGETLEESSSSEEEEEEEVVEEAMECEEQDEGSSRKTVDSTENASEVSYENREEDQESIGEQDEEIEEGEEVEEAQEPNRSLTPPDPSPPKSVAKSEELDTDEEIDRQLERELEDII